MGQGQWAGVLSEENSVILFHRKNKLKVEGNLYINGSKLPFSEEVNYLGLTLNRKLIGIRIWLLRSTNARGSFVHSGLLWGEVGTITQDGSLGYESLIVPSLAYGAMVWGHSNFNKATLDKLRQLNRLAACLTAPVRKTTPSAGLEVVLG